MTKDSENDSDIQGDGTDTRFRIKVCMKQFFNDERAYAYVCVRDRHRVHWLHRRLRALFALPPRFTLLSRGHLLPPDEPLAVLERDDTVDVVPARADVDPIKCTAIEHKDFTSCTAVSAIDCTTIEDNILVSRNAAPAPQSDVCDIDITKSPCKMKQNILNNGTATLEPEDEVDASTSAVEDDNDLLERKRQALAILEQYCDDSEIGENAPRAARPKRRRVRRRRRVAPPLDVTEDIASELENLTEVESAEFSSTKWREPEPPREGSVLRNGCQRSRQPRLIRTLDDESSI